jgi:hypothetical protein
VLEVEDLSEDEEQVENENERRISADEGTPANVDAKENEMKTAKVVSKTISGRSPFAVGSSTELPITSKSADRAPVPVAPKSATQETFAQLLKATMDQQTEKPSGLV